MDFTEGTLTGHLAELIPKLIVFIVNKEGADLELGPALLFSLKVPGAFP